MRSPKDFTRDSLVFVRRRGLRVTARWCPDVHYVVSLNGKSVAAYNSLDDAVGLCWLMAARYNLSKRRRTADERRKLLRSVRGVR